MNNRPLHKKIRDHLFYVLLVIFIAVLRLMPRRPALFLMRGLGRIAFRFFKGPRERAITHLSMVYGSELKTSQVAIMAERMFIHFAMAAGDMLRMPNIVRKGINKLVNTKGTEHLDKAFGTGKGLILITCHFGNWEVLGAWLAQNNYPMKVVGTTLFDPRLDKILVKTRNNAGYTTIARGKGTRDIIRTFLP